GKGYQRHKFPPRKEFANLLSNHNANPLSGIAVARAIAALALFQTRDPKPATLPFYVLRQD
ncbi:MAG: hypothetical protein QGD94_10165, partial [Planctomycetia bacterium]|nr:hypothetical protein [Planctomycetia bacterium]